MIGAVRHIDKLSKHSHSIYTHLKDLVVDNSGYASEQMKEECEKARKILENNVWEQKIIDAENTAFFKGAIRFMFTNEDGAYDPDWSSFDDRLNKSKEYFDEKGIRETYKADITTALVKSMNDWKKQLWWDKHVFAANDEEWRKILTGKDYVFPVCKIFDADNLDSVAVIDFMHTGPDPDMIKKQLLEDGVIKYIVRKYKNSRFRWNANDNCFYLYPDYASNGILFDCDRNKRNEKLTKIFNNIGIVCEKYNKIPGANNLFYGLKIHFSYKTTEYYFRKNLKVKNGNEWEPVKNSYTKEDITIDTLEDYLKSLN